MPKIYLDKDVLTAAFERIRWAFGRFDHVYCSISGGKDSSVMAQLVDMVARDLGRTWDALYIDFEAQYSATIEHVYELKGLPTIGTFYHVALPMQLRNAVSVLQPKWCCWDRAAEDLWVRPLPADAITEGCLPDGWRPWFRHGMEFEEFVPAFCRWYASTHPGTCACGVGIRADESLNRFRTVAMATGKEELDGRHWTTKVADRVYNFYPLYDWRTEDVWGAVSKFDLAFNRIYELMWRNGLSIHEQRLCQPYGDDQRKGLDQFKALEAETWTRVLNRVNGVNFGNIYCRTSALGDLRSTKPASMTWEQYSVYLLESIGLYNRDLMLHYVGKIRTFFRWWERHGVPLSEVPDQVDTPLGGRRVRKDKTADGSNRPSWRRVARALERNDFCMKRLSFTQTKSDDEKLKRFMGKWRNFLTATSGTTDKHLREVLELRGGTGDG